MFSMEKIFLPKFEEKKKRVLAKKTQLFLLNLKLLKYRKSWLEKKRPPDIPSFLTKLNMKKKGTITQLHLWPMQVSNLRPSRY